MKELEKMNNKNIVFMSIKEIHINKMSNKKRITNLEQ